VKIARSEFLQSLITGERVEVFDEWGSMKWRGAVEETAPELGVVWIRTEACERKLLDLREHSVRLLARAGTYRVENRR
jgi:hypothetical protein